jgi:hypothetical protein
MLVMVNTKMTFVFKHPKFYRIPRDKSDQVISKSSHDGESERAPGPGHKPQAPSSKPQASSNKLKGTSCSFDKTQAD